jgi:DNA-binding transcriptional MerR regulator
LKFPLTTEQACEVTGLSPRQLQWNDERGYVSPLHTSHRREYSRSEVLELILLYELRRRGIPRAAAKRAVERFRASERERKSRFMVNWLVVEVKGSIFLHFKEEDAIDSVTKAGLCVLVDVGEKRRELDSL